VWWEDSVVMASRKNHSPEDIVRLLQRHNELLGKELTVELVCREVGISSPTYCTWRQRYVGMSGDDGQGTQRATCPENKVETARCVNAHPKLGHF
jgi:transposase-like protein